MKMDDPAYPFLAFSGIPSVSFHFTEVSRVIDILALFGFLIPLKHNFALFFKNKQYPLFGTMLDTKKNLEARTSTDLLVVAKAAGEIAGVMALRLVHDHLLRLNLEKYKNVMSLHIGRINREVMRLRKVRPLTCTELRMANKHQYNLI